MDDLALWIGIAGTFCTIVFSVIAYRTGLKKDCRSDGAQEAGLRSDIECIKERTREILDKQREMSRDVGSITERLARAEASAASAHKRIDRIDEMLNNR